MKTIYRNIEELNQDLGRFCLEIELDKYPIKEADIFGIALLRHNIYDLEDFDDSEIIFLLGKPAESVKIFTLNSDGTTAFSFLRLREDIDERTGEVIYML